MAGHNFEVVNDEGRQRRRVLFPSDGNEGESNDSSDDEESDEELVGEEREYNGDSLSLMPNREKSDLFQTKTTKLDSNQTGDCIKLSGKSEPEVESNGSDDEDLETQNEIVMDSSNLEQSLSKKRKAVKEMLSSVVTSPKRAKKMSVSDEDENDAEIEVGDGKRIHPLKESEVRYTKLSQDKGSEIRNKIADALSMLECSGKSKSKSMFSKDEDDWSIDDKEDDDENYDTGHTDDDLSEGEFDGGSLGSSDGSDEDSFKSDKEETRSSQKTETSYSQNGALEDSIRWKANLQQKAADAFIERQASTQNLWKLVYGKSDFLIKH